MNSSLAKLAAALLLGTAMSGCSMIDGAQKASPPPDSSAEMRPNTSPKSMAAGLDAQVQSAQALRGKGDYAGATQILSQLMLVAPDNPRIVGEYGKNLIQQGRSKEALDFLKRAVQLQPSDWTIYSALGIAYDQNGDYANAKLAYQQALALKPGDAGVLNNFALSRMQAKDLSEARQLMARASTGTGASDPKIAQNAALLASLEPTTAPAVPAKSAPLQQTNAKPVVTHQAPPVSLGANVVAQSVPKDPHAGPVKQATAAPRKLTPDTAVTKKPETAPAIVAAPHKIAQTAPTNKKPASGKTPSLRMTADVSTP
jgi:Flp pilus assembly protein TadD